MVKHHTIDVSSVPKVTVNVLYTLFSSVYLCVTIFYVISEPFPTRLQCKSPLEKIHLELIYMLAGLDFKDRPRRNVWGGFEIFQNRNLNSVGGDMDGICIFGR